MSFEGLFSSSASSVAGFCLSDELKQNTFRHSERTRADVLPKCPLGAKCLSATYHSLVRK